MGEGGCRGALRSAHRSVCVRTSVCMCVCVYVRVYACVCLCVRARACVLVYMGTSIHMYIHMKKKKNMTFAPCTLMNFGISHQ